MSEYGAITPTTNGLTMITESVVKKKPIVFTKIAIGDGALTNQNIEALTALIRQKQEAPIHIVTDKGAGLADVSAVITNAGLSTGYYARELGVFAKVGDTGQEKLFAYTNAGANASYSPADGSLDEKLITVTFKIGTGATLKVALNSQVYLTLGNLEEHNTSSSAHADIRTKITNDINTHNSSSSAHADIRELFKWKKLYSVNHAAFVMPARGTALCDIPSTWKELHITWIWTKQIYTINNVVGYYSYTANIINEAIADPIIFVFPGSEGYLVVKNNKLYVIHRGDNDDGAPVLIMWR